MVDGKTRFRPVTGTEAQILREPYTPGYVYFASDTRKIFYDLDFNTRVTMGSAEGASVLYADGEAQEEFDTEGKITYILSQDDLEQKKTLPKVDDLILNSDGAFYRIQNIVGKILTCLRIAVSGTGGGGGSSGNSSAITMTTPNNMDLPSYTLINGQKSSITVVSTSATEDKVPLDATVTIHWALYEGNYDANKRPYDEGVLTTRNASGALVSSIPSGEPQTFEFGSRLRYSTSTTLIFYSNGINSGKSRILQFPNIKTVEMQLLPHATFNNTSIYNSNFTMACNVIGRINKIIKYYIDGEEVGSQYCAADKSGQQFYSVSGISHGYHVARIELFSALDEYTPTDVSVDPLEFEIAVNAGGVDPIIWLGDYASSYYNYDSIKIPFRVFNPNTGSSTVRFFKGITELSNSPRIVNNDTDQLLQITDGTLDVQNTYYIKVDGYDVQRTIQFEIEKDPNRDLSLVYPNNLMINFNAAGRSNDESASNRENWTDTFGEGDNARIFKAKFKNFNWHNNGWKLDKDNNTCLRISNGAEFSIPIGAMDMNTTTAGKQSVAFEFQFKVHNVQDYSNLIKEITRYPSDDIYWKAFQNLDANGQPSEEVLNPGYTSYDQFLAYYLQLKGIDYDSFTEIDVEKGQLPTVYKQINLNATFCRYYDANNKIGLCLGPQDGFFATGKNTLSVRYVEDQIANLTVVFNKDDNRIYMYLNGILTGVANNTASSKITINAPEIVFNSEFCDLDLYKFRVYNCALSVYDVDVNYAVDHASVEMYDHTTQLALYNRDLAEYQLDFKQMCDYNENNPDAQLMPYLVIETAPNDKLPYSKANKKTVKMTFVNTGLDRAFAKGELEAKAIADGLCSESSTLEERNQAVKKYYMHHCPSWTGENIELAVQGTSSEFYPRRNYKAKTKDASKNVNMYMNAGPYLGEMEQLKFFYFDNYHVGTTKFTLKIDFMESSGTYNMGFANLVKSAYSKHPLNDYVDAGALKIFDVERSETIVATSFDENADYYYFNHKGNLKHAIEEIGKVTTDNFAEGPNGMIAEEKKKLAADKNQYVILSKLAYSVPAEDSDKKITKSFLADLRTSVQGFPVLTYWKDSAGKYTFIGRYNMLLDKGADEAYGFALDGFVQAFAEDMNEYGQKPAVSDFVECWEFENNNRGYCSYRDPMNRDELSFEAFSVVNGKPTSTRLHASANPNAPVVVDSYEYRYHKDADTLDYIMDPTKNADKKEKAEKAHPELDFSSEPAVSEFTFNTYKNWEKAVQWVWSTCIDSVPSMGNYDVINLAAALYEPNVYWIYNGVTYDIAQDEEFDANETYFSKSGDKYISIKLTDNEDVVYQSGVYYVDVNGVKVLDESGIFDGSTDYYKLTLLTDEELEALTKKLPGDGVTYKGKTYKFDTKEYRLAKFTNELREHFDLEYCLVYWVMTETFLAYDSRGKNCMMASWGPLEPGKDYIWYPIFYDIDTQLGINNTGIPSFEYSVDASIEGCFSTSDSVLWQNLYTCFFADLKGKYHALKNNITNKNTGTNVTGPLYSVQHIEDWYLAKQDSYAMKGARPLIALNMDEFYKYISICNPKIQYQNRQAGMTTDSGTYFYALQGDRSLSRQQFLARRINFLDSWFSDGDYSRSDGSDIHGRIAANNPLKNSDKWITGSAANNAADAQGNPIQTNIPYYVKEGETIVLDERGYPKKTNYLDADIFVDMTPYQRSYVTLGDDNEAFDSKPYTGSPVKFDFPGTIANGIQSSGNYPEQLLYLYGAASLKDIGDISRLYWTEFYAKNSPHLSRILLGSDCPGFYNKALKMPDFDADLTNEGKPLLKEVNLTNVTIDNGDSSVEFNFESSEKMEIFKAVGSNINSVEFADGVALHTLYLPNTITELKLVEANNLTKVLDKYIPSTYEPSTDVWTAERGLYIQGLTDLTSDELITAGTDIGTIIITGGKLGYDSLKILKTLYAIKKRDSSNLHISMTNVDWSPYQKLDEGFKYVVSDKDKYFMDDGHYGFIPYNKDYVEATWNKDILNGLVYRIKDNAEETMNMLLDVDMFKDFYMLGNFMNTDDFNNDIPELSGEIFINNVDGTAEDESFIRNTLLEKYPKVSFHFAKVKKAFSAQFILLNYDEKDQPDGTYTIVGTQKISREQFGEEGINYFTSPYYNAAQNTGYEVTRDNYDFHGWSTTPYAKQVIPANNWYSEDNKIKADVTDYTYYAVFTRHPFQMNFYTGTVADGFDPACDTIPVLYGDYIPNPGILPGMDESKLDKERRYGFLGWTQDKTKTVVTKASAAKLVNVEGIPAINDYNFYAVFIEESVYDKVTSTDFFNFTWSNLEVAGEAFEQNIDYKGWYIEVKPNVKLKGKITLPISYTDGTRTGPIKGILNYGFRYQDQITHVFWERTDPAKNTSPCLYLGESSFNSCSNLQYFEYPAELRQIGISAFAGGCSKLEIPDFTTTPNLTRIGNGAYNGSLWNGAKGEGITPILFIPGTVISLEGYIFGFPSVKNDIALLQIGTNEVPTRLTKERLSRNAFVLSHQASPTFIDVVVYYDSNTSQFLSTADNLTNIIQFSGEYSGKEVL